MHGRKHEQPKLMNVLEMLLMWDTFWFNSADLYTIKPQLTMPNLPLIPITVNPTLMHLQMFPHIQKLLKHPCDWKHNILHLILLNQIPSSIQAWIQSLLGLKHQLGTILHDKKPCDPVDWKIETQITIHSNLLCTFFPLLKLCGKSVFYCINILIR